MALAQLTKLFLVHSHKCLKLSQGYISVTKATIERKLNVLILIMSLYFLTVDGIRLDCTALGLLENVGAYACKHCILPSLHNTIRHLNSVAHCLQHIFMILRVL